MKTSNKLLLGFYLIGLFLTLVSMIYVKGHMVITQNKSLEGNGELITKVLTESYDSHILKLSAPYIYTLDPNSDQLTITTDANLIDQFRVSDEGKLRLYREGNISFNPSEKVKVKIGIANKDIIEIQASSLSIINSTELISQKKMRLDFKDSSNGNLTIHNDSLMVRMRDRSKLSLVGELEYLDLDIEDHADFLGNSIELLELKLKAEDHSTMKDLTASEVSIVADDHALLGLNKKWTKGYVKLGDRAEIQIVGESTMYSEDQRDN